MDRENLLKLDACYDSFPNEKKIRMTINTSKDPSHWIPPLKTTVLVRQAAFYKHYSHRVPVISPKSCPLGFIALTGRLSFQKLYPSLILPPSRFFSFISLLLFLLPQILKKKKKKSPPPTALILTIYLGNLFLLLPSTGSAQSTLSPIHLPTDLI